MDLLLQGKKISPSSGDIIVLSLLSYAHLQLRVQELIRLLLAYHPAVPHIQFPSPAVVQFCCVGRDDKDRNISLLQHIYHLPRRLPRLDIPFRKRLDTDKQLGE